MKKWTKQLLEESGYEIENAQIESVRLTMADHGVLTSDLVLNGHGWGALIQNLRCDADLTDEQVQKIIRIGDRYWEMVGKFKEEDMTPDEFADYITAKSEQVEKELRERWS